MADLTENCPREDRGASRPSVASGLAFAVTEHMADGFFVKDPSGHYLYCNSAWSRILGQPVEKILGLNDIAFLEPNCAAATGAHERRVIESGQSELAEHAISRADLTRHYEINISPYLDSHGMLLGVIGIAREVIAQKLEARIQVGQSRILERIATGDSLTDVLNEIAQFVEELLPGALCSVLIANHVSQTLRFGAAPNLPAQYNSAVDGVPIKEGCGSCGTAAFRRKPVMVADVRLDELWNDYRELAAPHGLCSCCSLPVFSAANDEADRIVLGTFALYRRQPGLPERNDLEAIRTAAHLAGIALEKYQAAQRLRASHELFHTVVDQAADAFFLHDLDGRLVDVNRRACESLHYTREQLLDLNIHDIDQGQTLRRNLDLWRRVLSGHEATFEGRYRRKDGTEFPVEVRIGIVEPQGRRLILELARDISERKVAEEVVMHQQQMLNDAQSFGHLGSFDWDITGNRVDWSDELHRIYGLEPGEFKATVDDFLQRVVPEDRQHVSAVIQQVLQSGDEFQMKERILRTDGQVRILESLGKVYRNEQGKPLRMTGICQDITERQHAEDERHRAVQELRTSEERFSKLFYKNPLSIIVATYPDGKIQDANDTFLRYFHCSREMVLGKTTAELQMWENPSDREFMLESLAREKCLRNGEFWFRTTTGEKRLLLLSVEIVEIAGQEMSLAMSTDITERRRAEAELQKTGDLLRAIADGTTDAIYVKDREGKYLLFNAAAARLVGMRAEDAIGKDDTAIFSPESAAITREMDRRIMQTGKSETKNNTLTASGVTRTYHTTKSPYYDEQGNLAGVIGVSRDVTEQVLAEKERTESEERYRLAILATKEAVWDYDPSTGEVFWNEQYTTVFGRPADASSWEWWIEHLHEEDRNRTVTSFRDAIDGRSLYWACDYRFLRADGVWAEVQDRAYILRDETGKARRLVGTVHDITSRKEAEQSLRLTQFSIDHAADSIFWINPTGKILYANEAAARTLGFEREELIGKTVPEIDPNFPVDAWPAHWEEIKKRKSFTFESDHETKSGRNLKTEVTVNYLQYEGQEYNCAVMRDLTDRKQTEEDLKHLWQNAIDPLCIAGSDGHFKKVNPAWTNCLGWTEQELLERPWLDFIHPDDRQATIEAGKRLLRSESVSNFENRYLCKDGSYRWFSWNTIPQKDRGVNYGFVRDMTERKHLEAQFQQAQKMEAIGRLAGGVAHDFNNVLTIINGYSSLLLKDLPKDSPLRESAAAILDGGNRAAALTQQLLAFSRKAIVESTCLDLNVIVDKTMTMMRRLIEEDIQVTVVCDPNLPRINASPGQIEQILMNIVVNSRDAMPDGGTISIQTRAVTIGVNDRRHDPDLAPGRYAKLTITDTGHGMTHEIKEKIFEPFFTTKEVGKGTGLGLSVVHGVIKQCGGTVSVESQLNVGTTIEILLPAVETVTAIESHPTYHSNAGHETILLVEDEDAVRKIVRIGLEKVGYKVLEASGGKRALQLVDQTTDQIHLLLVDVVMPEMGGPKLAEQLRRIRPGIRVLFMSGYTDDAVLQRGVQEAKEALLQKPFTAVALAKKVREILDDVQSSS